MNRERRKWLKKAMTIIEEQMALAEADQPIDQEKVKEAHAIVESIREEEDESFASMEEAGLDQTPNGITSQEAIEALENAASHLVGEASFDDLEEAGDYVYEAMS